MSFFKFPHETQDAFLFFTLCATSHHHISLLCDDDDDDDDDDIVFLNPLEIQFVHNCLVFVSELLCIGSHSVNLEMT